MRNMSFRIALALALTASVATVGSAQARDGNRGANRPDRAAAGEQVREARGQGRMQAALFKGITLTGQQKAQLQALRGEQRAEFQRGAKQRGEAKAQRGTQRGASRDAQRARPDSATMATRRAEMQKRAEQHHTAVRNILTAEQRVQFDKNVAEFKARGNRKG